MIENVYLSNQAIKISGLTILGLKRSKKLKWFNNTPKVELNVIPLGTLFEYANRPACNENDFRVKLQETTKNIKKILAGVVYGTSEFLNEKIFSHSVHKWFLKNGDVILITLDNLSKFLDETSIVSLRNNPHVAGFVSLRKIVEVEIIQRKEDFEIKFTIKNQLFSIISPSEEVRNPKDNSNSIKHETSHSVFYFHKKE